MQLNADEYDIVDNRRIVHSFFSDQIYQYDRPDTNMRVCKGKR